MNAPRAAILLAAALLGAACDGGMGGSRIVIATDATYPPMESIAADGTIVGFDVDLMRAVCREEGLEAEFINQGFDGILPGLSQGRYNAVASSLSITEDRARAVDFTDPYYSAGQVVGVLAKETGIRGLEDLGGKTIAVQRSTTGHRAAQKVPGAVVKDFETVNEAYMEVQAGRADAVINDYPPTFLYVKEHPEVRIVGRTFTEENYGFAVRKGNAALLGKLNDGLRKVKASGEYERLKAKWLGETGR